MDLSEDIQPSTTSSVFLGGTTEVTFKAGNKAKLSLRNRGIEWNTFKEHYTSLQPEQQMPALLEYAERMFGLLGITSDNLGQSLCDYFSQDMTILIQKIRKHLYLQEPLSWSIREVFFALVHIYENLLKQLVTKEEWDSFMTEWIANDPEETSSKPLWNLTRDPDFKAAILSHHKNLESWLNMTFQYKGFCPKVPAIRLGILLQFPARELITQMHWDDEEKKINDMSKGVCDVIASSQPLDMNFAAGCVRPDPPVATSNPIEIIDSIILCEQKMLPALEALETHYLNKAKLFNMLSKLLVPS